MVTLPFVKNDSVMTMQPTRRPAQATLSWWTDLFFLTLVLGGLMFIFLGTRPLFVPDEGRYAEIAREMVVSKNYITPHLNGIKYFEKPVLFYWLGAAAIKIGGLNLWSIRSINALLGLFGCLITYLTARKLYDRTTGLLSALILGTSLLYFVMAHMISLDLPVTVFLAGSLYAFILGTQASASRPRRLYLYTAAISAALAVLTKGLIGIIFPLMVIGAWIVMMNEWRLLKRLFIPSSLLLFIAVAAPWHVMVASQNPEFLYFYFIEQHFLRYATMDIGHYQPAWFFIPTLILGFFPWIVFLPQTIKNVIPPSWRRRSEKQTEIFFFLWIVLVFGFFSFSKSKLIPYILPIFPPLALLTGLYLAKIIQKKPSLSLRISVGLLIPFAAIFVYGFWQLTKTELIDPLLAQKILLSASTILLLGTTAAFSLLRKNAINSLIILISTLWVFLVMLMAAIPAIDTRSVLPFAVILNKTLQPQDEVIAYNQYYQDLPFYLQRTISIANWRNELSFGLQHQPANPQMLDDKAFWEHFTNTNRVFVVMSVNEYEQLKTKNLKKTYYLLAKTPNNVLISNQSP